MVSSNSTGYSDRYRAVPSAVLGPQRAADNPGRQPVPEGPALHRRFTGILEEPQRHRGPKPLLGHVAHRKERTGAIAHVAEACEEGEANEVHRGRKPRRLAHIELLRPWPDATQKKNEAPAGGVAERNSRLNEESAVHCLLSCERSHVLVCVWISETDLTNVLSGRV
ncbi:hypothetical protein NPIL_209201 [Nephila pilipes]|uniref:Uncharacterized protein n=1 Tax=Nephila pilipes TaxID=299642 RepID=A0A8X6TWV3_NEPPI|nr:hypothetical protein NPIL_209201 [Nephila pilipes]